MTRSLCVAMAVAAAAGFGAVADDEPSPRAQLETICQTEGESEEACTCFGAFVAENFTDREMAGAVAVFTDPALADNRENPPETVTEWFTTLASLSDRVQALGISEAEMFTVFFRVLELREAAMEQCTAS